ncbi:hypothetical protein NWP17_16825 [Chrysosporum bergii ANA360D]|jgi:hypothetical protein|uniref:Uncharacterized protein n=1 Tax=Chrysosporum bergii ANA360D TaxID=617107 RepID=A0AA43GUJ6_9CYAN|nr:hypothetical protein [Chrysosporum bergii]MDH6062077.1 hypothetical protein [Chrysosporum bergii ANA360D]
MNKPDKLANNNKKFVVEKQIQEERIHDVFLLLQNLISREETTVKILLDCLYDVGSHNLINHKFPGRTLNVLLKFISHTSKPIFRIFAWRWFKNNGSQLITNWLQSKVTFKTSEEPKTQLVRENPQSNLDSVTNSQYQLQEVKHLRSQVTLLTGILAGVVTMFGGSFVWLGYSLERSHMQRIVELQTQVKTLEARVNEPE